MPARWPRLERLFCFPESPISNPPNGLLPPRNPAARNGIFGCRDRRPKIGSGHRNVHRDGKSGDDTGEIRAETASFRSTTVSAVREDWMVVCAVTCEPVSPGHSPENWEFFAKFSK